MNNRLVVAVPYLFLGIAITLSLYTPFSHWAINSDSLGKHDMGLALFFSFTSPLAVYVSSGISVICFFMALFYRKVNSESGNILFIAVFVALLPVAYVFLLNIGSH